jgi:hypothetical protein
MLGRRKHQNGMHIEGDKSVCPHRGRGKPALTIMLVLAAHDRKKENFYLVSPLGHAD